MNGKGFKKGEEEKKKRKMHQEIHKRSDISM